MSKLLLQPTDTAQWHALVNEAQHHCAVHLNEELESYLVFLLMRFIGRPEMTNSIVALDFLHTLHVSGTLRSDLLRDVGDKCLLFSGLFPGIAKYRRLDNDYYIVIGQNAYYALSTLTVAKSAELYTELCKEFIPLKDVLTAMRGECSLDKWMNKVSKKLDKTVDFFKTIGDHKVH